MIYLIFLIPIVISLIAKYVFKADINWKEFIIQFVGGVAALSLIWVLGRYSAAHDVEVLNGYVTGKHMDHFMCPTNTSNPCQNGYTCHSHRVCSGSGKDRTCHEEHDTCYVYAWEQDWYVDSTLGAYEISRVDRQGADEPARYSVPVTGDPVSSTHDYNNWVKAASDSLYAQDKGLATRYASIIPKYEIRIYDYYKIDRVYLAGLKLDSAPKWNTAISRALGPLGKPKQINFNLVIVEGADRDFAPALRRAWDGFKKNEAVLVIGLKGGQIDWAESMSWSKNSIYDVDMRNMVEERRGTTFATIDPVEFMGAASAVIKTDYVRRPMKEFEYLKGDIPPPTWMIWTAIIFAFVYGIGTSIVFNRYEI